MATNTTETVPTGAIRYNTDSNKMECFNGTKWMQVAVSESAPIGARGIVGGGNGASDVIQYNTIATTGNGVDWGDLPDPNGSYAYAAGLSDSHGGIS